MSTSLRGFEMLVGRVAFEAPGECQKFVTVLAKARPPIGAKC